MNKLIPLRTALESPDWLGSVLGAPSYATVRSLLLAALGEPLTADELAVFTKITGRAESPSEPVAELWLVAGRRSGKTLAIAVLAAFLAGCCDHRSVLAPGERGTVIILAANMSQGHPALNILKSIFTDIPRFAGLVDKISFDTISLLNRIDIRIRPASWRTVRGLTAIAVIAEECAVWLPEDGGSKNPDRQILNAARPALATTRGGLYAIGSPLFKRGETWRTYQKHFGPKGSPAILVANAPTRVFNPVLDQAFLDRAFEEDPQSAACEFGGEFRDDSAAYVTTEAVAAVIDTGTRERAWRAGVHYTAHVDAAAGGGEDSFALAIGHVEEGIGILDCLIERKPPFSPEGTIAELCDILADYQISRVCGDNYANEFNQEQFRKNGVEYDKSDLSTSDYFINFLSILNSKRCLLLDNRRLAGQLTSLERTSSRSGGKDVIKHPSGAHDDIAAATAGLMVRLVGRRDWQLKSFHSPAGGGGRASMVTIDPGTQLPANVAQEVYGVGAGVKPGTSCPEASAGGVLGGQFAWTHTQQWAPEKPEPVVLPAIPAADVVIPPVVEIRSTFGLQGVRQGDVVTMKGDGESEYHFKTRVGLPA
jgi:hypothetical protein